MKNIKQILIFLAIFLILVVPALSFAQTTSGTVNQPAQPQSTTSALVPCNNTPDASGNIAQPCNFNALMTLVNNIVNFVLYFMVIPIAAILFTYAGFELITAGGESAHARQKAKSIFTNAVIGLIIAMACWLIVKLVLYTLGYDGAWIGF